MDLITEILVTACTGHHRVMDIMSREVCVTHLYNGKHDAVYCTGGEETQRHIESTAYRKTSNIRRLESQNLNDYHLVLKLPLPSPLEPDVQSIIKVYLEQRRQSMLHLHLRDQHFYRLLRCDGIYHRVIQTMLTLCPLGDMAGILTWFQNHYRKYLLAVKLHSGE